MEKSMKIMATVSNWSKVYEFLVEYLEKSKLSQKSKNEVCIACEEIYINISNYAYTPDKGNVEIYLLEDKLKSNISVVFEDEGIKFNPLNAEKPQTYGTVSERKIGGLGIFMARKLTDKMEYTYENGKNRLKLIKNINKE